MILQQSISQLLTTTRIRKFNKQFHQIVQHETHNGKNLVTIATLTFTINSLYNKIH